MKFLFLIFLIIGCSTNTGNYRMPANRFNTPEVTGGSIFALDLKGRTNVNYGASNRVSTSNEIGAMIGQETAEVSIEGATQLGLRLDLSLFDRMDFYLNYALQSPGTGGLKWQFLGKTEEAFSPGWKSSIALGLGGSSTENKVLPIEGSSSTTYVTGSNDLSVMDFNWHIGYRFPVRLLLYLNVNYSTYTNDITVSQTNAGVVTSYSKKPKSENLGLILGLEYYFKSKESFLIGELGWSQGKVDSNDAQNSIASLGINFGWRFE